MTETDICNLALGMLGHDRAISGDFRTATSTEAMRCRLFFDASRKSVLSADGCHWRFAEDRIVLTLPEPGRRHVNVTDFPYLYQLPEDCLSIIRLHRHGEELVPVDYCRYGACVGCCEERATVVYVRDAEDVSEWPQPPLDALAAELAARLSGPMTGDVAKARAARSDARNALAEAQLWNAKQFDDGRTADGRHIESRNGHCHGRRSSSWGCRP